MASYLLAICEVTNPTEEFKTYAARSADLVHQHGGKYIIRGPAAEVVKGDQLKGKYIIVSEFESTEQLKAFLYDEEYVNEVAPLREGTGIYDFAICESPPPAMA